jgi:Raf kinase inhibitor-like YbhB/YbcL family protein
MWLRLVWLRLAPLAAFVALSVAPAAASNFSLETSAFLDGGMMPKTDAAGGSCGGRNLSPPLRLSGYPASTRSFAIVAFDTDARHGAGFTHWVAYGLAPGRPTLPPGFGTQASPAFVGGTNDAGTRLYFGPCPPVGDAPHHYVFTAYALELAPGALEPGLSRAAFLRALAGHGLAQARITGLFSR